MKIELVDSGYITNNNMWCKWWGVTNVIEEVLSKDFDLSIGSLLEVLRWQIEAWYLINGE
jgi:hypothetical protein